MIDSMNITPSVTSSADDFDFLVGKWSVHNRKLKTRLTGSDDWTEFTSTLEMRKVLNGIGNVETFDASFDDKPFAGMAVRVFNPATRLWSIYWADSNSGVLDKNPVVGSFAAHLGKFYAADEFNGRQTTVLYQWDKTDTDAPVWSQAFSLDKGDTWEWNWFMQLVPADKAREATR
jgi:hypothetical protein